MSSTDDEEEEGEGQVEEEDYSAELYHAVEANDKHKLRLVLARGAEVNQFFDDCGVVSGKTILHIACEKGRTECVKMLLDYGAEVEFKDKWGMTPLMYCMITQFNETADMLLDRCPEAIWSRDMYGKTALHCAVESGNLDSVQILLRHGACADYANSNGVTPLMTICMMRDEDVAIETQVEMSRRLLEAGADINIKDYRDKRTALQWACVRKKLSLVELLLTSGADPNILDSAGRSCATNLMASHVRITDDNRDIDPDVMTILVQLTQSGLDLDLNKCEYSNPLSVACFLKADVLVRFFLESGADPDVIFISRVTPLLIAVSRKDSRCVQTLLNWTCRLDRKGRVCRRKLEEHNWDPMELAIDLGCWDIIVMLVTAGYNISRLEYFATPEIDEDTPKSLAENPEMFFFLQDLASNPRTLFHITSLTICRAIRRNVSENIQQLPLPPRLLRMMTSFDDTLLS